MKRSLLLCTLLITLSVTTTLGQGNKEMAFAKAKTATRFQKQGKPDEAIKLLVEAIRLDPDNNSYVFTLASLYNKKKNYNKSIEILKPLIDQDNENDSSYLMLGQAYKMAAKPTLSSEAYEKGLQKFPKSGALYEELGNIYSSKKNDSIALNYYEKGIELDPNCPGNYYRAAKIFFKGPEEVWGVMYGEIFMNLERNGTRNFEISRLIHNTYKSQIKFGDENTINMTAEKFIKSDDKYADLMHPFGIAVYEQILVLSISEEEKINIYAMDRMRRHFVTYFFNGEVSKKYPNALFEYQREINKAGHMEAYNFWVLRKGDENGFNIWKAAYKKKWAAFEKWFPTFSIRLDDNHKLYRDLYKIDGRKR